MLRLASNTTPAVEGMNRKAHRRSTPAYQEYLEATSGSANLLAATIAAFTG
jgi:hypothetical protein